MSAFDEAVRSVKVAQDTKQNKIEWQPATLGNGKGQIDVGNNMVNVRLVENSSVIEVINGGVPLVDGLLVRIIKPAEDPLHWYAVRATDQRVDENAIDPTIYANVGPHHRTHEYLAADQINIDWRQLTNLRVYAIAGTLTVGVLPGIIPRPGADLVVASQVINLASHVPAAGALYCLISIDSTGTIVATDGTAVDSPIDLALTDIPDTPTGNFRLAAVRLYATQTTISESTQSNDMRDLRWPQEYGALIPPGTTAAITTYYLDNAATSLNIVDACLDLSPTHVIHAAGSTARTGDGVNDTLFMQRWRTALGYPGVNGFPAGLWTVTLQAETDGSPIAFYFEASRVDGGGTPTLLFTSSTSASITTLQQITITASAAAVTMLSTDRLLIDVWAISGSPIPGSTHITVHYDGAIDSHLVVPGQSTYRFIDLTDVPTSYSGQALKSVRVNAGATGLEFSSSVNGLGWFNVEDYGAVHDNSTDDTAAIQAAINAAETAGGGVVYFPRGRYVIAGALQDAARSNAQILLPRRNTTTQTPVAIMLLGEVQAPQTIWFSGAAAPTGGTILRGTLNTGAGGSLLGGEGPSGSYLNFSYCHVKIQNILFELPANPVFTGLDLRYMISAEVRNVMVNAGGVYGYIDFTQPTTATSYGIRPPQNSNATVSYFRDVNVAGFYNGWEIPEHFNGDVIYAMTCLYGAIAVAGDHNHPAFISRLGTQWCKYGISFSAGTRLIISEWQIEHWQAAPSKWFDPVYDVDDASNLGVGHVFYNAVIGGTGNADPLVKNGGANWQTLLLTNFIGDVRGPSSAVDSNIAIFDGVTGKLIKDGGYTIAGVISAASIVSEVLMADGVTPPDPLTTEDEIDWLYSS